MKKLSIMVAAVLAVAGTCVFAAQYKANIKGATYSSDGTKITSEKFDNKDLIGTNKGAVVVMDDKANAILTVSKTGATLKTNVVFGSPFAVTTKAVKGSLSEQVFLVGFETSGGAGGNLIVDQKTTVTSKGTNVTAKASGLSSSSNNLPGVVSLTVGGAFKPSTK